MKKLITILLSTCVATSALAQGSLSGFPFMFNHTGISLYGTDPNDPSAVYFTGNVSIALYYAAAGTVTQNQINILNSYDGVNGAPIVLAMADGFIPVSTISPTTTTIGPVDGFTVTDGRITSGPDKIGLANVPTGGSGWLFMIVTAIGGPDDSENGAVAFFQPNLGGNPLTDPPGLPAPIVTDPANLNVVLFFIPEPNTLALAAFGGAALLAFRSWRPRRS